MATLAQTRAAELVTPYIEDFYLAVGRATVNVYFRDCTESILTRILASPARAQKAVEKALGELTPAKPPARRLPYASVIRISILEEAVRAAPDLKGIPISEALSLLETKLCEDRIRGKTLAEFLRRTRDHHSLAIRAGRLRLKSEMVVEILRERHLQQREREGG